MAVNNTESLSANSSSETRSVFYCPKSPHFSWDLNHTTSLEIILAITIIACPVTFLLNLLVIIAVKTRRELKRNSNILLSRLAVTDVLVGVVSLPLTIIVDALVLQRILFEDVVCTINSVSVFALHILYSVSFLHLLLIAWERYVAIAKWMKYKVIVTKGRVNKYARVAWLAALLTVTPQKIMKAVGVRYEVTKTVDVAASLFWGACFFLIAYFYVKAYIGVRRWNRIQLCTLSVNALLKAKRERKIFRTASWLTIFAGISGITATVVYFVSPFLRAGYSFRWAETILQLNSLFNPLLYFYSNRQLRKAALELLWRRKRPVMEPVSRTVRRTRRRRYSVASLDFEELQIRQKIPPYESFDAATCLDNARRGSNEAVKERPISAPSKVFTQQRNKVVVTAQIENAQRRKFIQRKTDSPKETTELELRSPHEIGDKLSQSRSLNGNSRVTLRSRHQRRKIVQRSNSVPILLTNELIGQETNCY